MPILIAGKTKSNGYAYLMLLVVAASGCLIASLLSIMVFSRTVKAEKENELIFRGLAYIEAIKSYYDSSKNKKIYPVSMEDLLSDPRFPDKKHIRRLYIDPITHGNWSLITNTEGGIVGVVSKSKAKPLKQTGFPEQLKSFESAQHYSDWLFVAKR